MPRSRRRRFAQGRGPHQDVRHRHRSVGKDRESTRRSVPRHPPRGHHGGSQPADFSRHAGGDRGRRSDSLNMAQPFTQVDAFTDRPFTGNPAAVCLLPSPRDAHWMQQIASEMNLAETAFLVRRPDGFDLRWFTPGAEVDLCGHATLASAHALWEEGHLKPSEDARFYTRSGLLTATRLGDHIWLDFPSTPVSSAARLEGLEQALGRKATMVGRTVFDYLVELDSEAALRSLAPDMTLLAGIPYRGVIVTAPPE